MSPKGLSLAPEVVTRRASPAFGSKSVDEVKEKLTELGVALKE